MFKNGVWFLDKHGYNPYLFENQTLKLNKSIKSLKKNTHPQVYL